MTPRSPAANEVFPSLSSGIGADGLGLRQFECSLDRIVGGSRSQDRAEPESYTVTHNSRFQFFHSKRASINDSPANDLATREDSLIKAWRTVTEIDALLGSDFRPAPSAATTTTETITATSSAAGIAATATTVGSITGTSMETSAAGEGEGCGDPRTGPAVDEAYVKRLSSELEAALNVSLTFKERYRAVRAERSGGGAARGGGGESWFALLGGPAAAAAAAAAAAGGRGGGGTASGAKIGAGAAHAGNGGVTPSAAAAAVAAEAAPGSAAAAVGALAAGGVSCGERGALTPQGTSASLSPHLPTPSPRLRLSEASGAPSPSSASASYSAALQNHSHFRQHQYQLRAITTGGGIGGAAPAPASPRLSQRPTSVSLGTDLASSTPPSPPLPGSGTSASAPISGVVGGGGEVGRPCTSSGGAAAAAEMVAAMTAARGGATAAAAAAASTVSFCGGGGGGGGGGVLSYSSVHSPLPPASPGRPVSPRSVQVLTASAATSAGSAAAAAAPPPPSPSPLCRRLHGGGGGIRVAVGSALDHGMWDSDGVWRAADPVHEVYVPPHLQRISPDDLIKVRELGRGCFGSVWLARWRGVEVALKELINQNNLDGPPNEVFYEAERLAALRHPAVIAFYGIVTAPGCYATVVEYLRTGSLKSGLSRLRRQGADISRRLRAAIALQAARGMEYLHAQYLVHFDLKADNLLCDLRDPARPVVKIGDLGLSKKKKDSFVSGNMRGTLPWMAPELFPGVRDRQRQQAQQQAQQQGAGAGPGADAAADSAAAAAAATDPRGGDCLGDDDRVNEKVDVFSFGVVLWEIWQLGEQPYSSYSLADIFAGVLTGSLRPGVPPDCDPHWAQLMTACWDSNPRARPSFCEIADRLEIIQERLAQQEGAAAAVGSSSVAAAATATGGTAGGGTAVGGGVPAGLGGSRRL